MRRGAALLALLTGCAGGEDLTIHLPERSEAVRTLVVAYEAAGALSVEAHAVGAEGVLLERSSEIDRVTVLYYDESAAELGLEPGPVPAARPGECLSTLLPRTFELAITRAPGDDAHTELSSLEEPLASFRFRAPCPCYDFDVAQRIPIDEPSIRGVVAGPKAALVVAPNRIYRISDTGVMEEIDVPDHTLSTAFGAPDGRVWLGTTDGVLLVGSPESGFIETATGATARIIALDGYRGGAPLELFSVHDDGAIRRFDDTGTWEVLYAESESTSQLPDVAWIDEGRAIALQDGGAGPVHFERARIPQVTLERWDAVEGPPAAVGAIDGVGVFLANRTHQLYRQEGRGTWELIEDDRADSFGTIRDFIPFAGGMLLAGDSGRIAHYHPEVGYCFDANLGENVNIRFVGLAGERIVAGGEHATDNAILLLDARSR